MLCVATLAPHSPRAQFGEFALGASSAGAREATVTRQFAVREAYAATVFVPGPTHPS